MTEENKLTSGPIVHKNLAVLQVEEPQVFNEIRVVLPLDDYCLGYLSETAMLMDPRRVKELLAANRVAWRT